MVQASSQLFQNSDCWVNLSALDPRPRGKPVPALHAHAWRGMLATRALLPLLITAHTPVAVAPAGGHCAWESTVPF